LNNWDHTNGESVPRLLEEFGLETSESIALDDIRWCTLYWEWSILHLSTSFSLCCCTWVKRIKSIFSQRQICVILTTSRSTRSTLQVQRLF